MHPFQRFQRRFRSERLASAGWAGCAGALGGIAASLVFRLLGRPLPLFTRVAVSASLCLLCAWAGYRRARVSRRAQAVRLDAAGLEERAVTLEENLGQDAPMALLQRQDAEEKLRALPPERIVVHRPKGLMLAAALLLLLVLGLFCAAGGREQSRSAAESQEQLALRQRMLEMEAVIQNSALSEAEKALLLEELNRLSVAPESMEASLRQMDSLERLWEAFERARELEEKRQHSFAGFLTRYALTHDLGVAILESSPQMLEEAFDGMALHCVPEDLVPENAQALAEDIFRAGKDTEQQDLEYLDVLLWTTLRDMAYSLQEALELPPGEGAEAVRKALGDKRAFLRQVLFGDDPKNQEQPENAGGGEGCAEESAVDAAELAVSGLRAGGGAAGAGLGGGEEEKQRVTVLCYDPTLDTQRRADYVPGAPGPDGTPQRQPASEGPGQGLTPYDRVLGAYYAEYLRQELPEDIRQAVGRYFDGL